MTSRLGSLRLIALLLPLYACFSAASTGCTAGSDVGTSEDDFAHADGLGGKGYGNGYGYGYGHSYGYRR